MMDTGGERALLFHSGYGNKISQLALGPTKGADSNPTEYKGIHMIQGNCIVAAMIWLGSSW